MIANYEKTVKRSLAPIVSVAWLHDHLDRENLVVLDVRGAAAYAADHIPGSVNEPFVVPFSAWSTMRDDLLLAVPGLGKMARGALRRSSGKMGNARPKTIVYCGVGGYASALWFVLTQVLGYENVKFFDGAAQEWARYYDMVPYRWE